MRRSLYALIACTALSPFTALADDITVDSTIKAATVYMDRATLTRSAKVEIPAGAHTLVFDGLPVNLYTNSLRADGKAKAKVTFGAVSHKRANFEDYIVPKEKELNAQLLVLQDQKRVLNAEKQALQVGRTFLENIGKQAILRENEEIATLALNPESWANAADGLTTKMAQNLKMSIEADVKIRKTDNKIRKIQNDLRGLRTGQKQSYTVSIPFESDKDTTLSIDLDYQLPNVGWTPAYDARLDTKSGALELVQYGSVWQRTGEDWEGVELTLSTAQPSRGASLPELHPNWISILRHQPPRAIMKRTFGGAAQNTMAVSSAPVPMESLEKADAEMAVYEEVVSIQSAQINTNGFVGEYKITGPAEVKSGGEQSKLLIGTFDIESKLQVHVKPQIDPNNAYLTAIATLKGEAPILPGQVSLFRDGAFIGQDHMSMLRQGDEQDLGFGIDDNVTVSRNLLTDERSEAGMIVKDNVLERHYVTEIKNLHKDPIEVAVFETMPASKDERARVELLQNMTSQGYKSDISNKKGVMGWAYTLKPKEKFEHHLGWKISWPKGENLSGL